MTRLERTRRLLRLVDIRPGEATRVGMLVCLYVFLTGQAVHEKYGKIVSEIKEKEAFGTLGAPDFHPRFYTAKAIDHVHAIKLDARDFHDLLSLNIEMVEAVFRVLCRHIRDGLFNA